MRMSGSRSGGFRPARSFRTPTRSAVSSSTWQPASCARSSSCSARNARSRGVLQAQPGWGLQLGILAPALLLGQEPLELVAQVLRGRNLLALAGEQVVPVGREGVV